MTVPISRRNLLAAAAAGSLATCWNEAAPALQPTKEPNVAMVQVTDLFRPVADPDDHWDLACTYALAMRGDVELLGVMIDFPPRADMDPDVQAVAQMNYMTGLSVPVIVGSPRRIDPGDVDRPENKAVLGGVRTLLDILRKSLQPVVINILGSSRDVALAGKLESKLFAEKCAGVYLNAGSGTSDKALTSRLEYNVVLDPLSYAAIFALPCPVYWMPCFDVAPGPRMRHSPSGRMGLITSFSRKTSCRIFPRGCKTTSPSCSNRVGQNRASKNRRKRCARIGCTIWKGPGIWSFWHGKAISTATCGVPAVSFMPQASASAARERSPRWTR